MNFIPINLGLREQHARLWALTPLHTADYTFTNLWGWAPCYGLEWSEAHNLGWIRRTKRGEMPTARYWAPLGDWNTADWEAILADTPAGTIWDRVPEQLYSILLTVAPDRVHIEETPEQWEYLYDAKALATLSGNKLHKKRNHVNAYMRTYGEDYRVLSPEDIEHVLMFEYDWCKCHECDKSPSLQAENEAIIRVLSCWKQLPDLMGAALFVEGRMSAFTVGEALDEHTLVVHFEKGRPEYRGVYQAINACFARTAGAPFKRINREQDAGEEGLRQAKKSYYPSGFIVKNRVVFS